MAATTTLRNASSVDRDTRLEDYLNDKLQTFADFDTLDSLINEVRTQQGLLQKQLEDAKQELRDAEKASISRAAAAKQEGEDFQREQADINRRLRIITQSDVSDDAVQRFESSMGKLRQLDVASGYFEMLLDVENMNTEALARLKQSPEAALSSYTRLRHLLTALGQLQAAAEGAAPHLVDHVERTTLALRTTIRDTLAADLDSILTKILWPKSVMPVPPTLQSRWDSAIFKLLILQQPELEAAQDLNARSVERIEPIVLLPLEVMVQPLAVRFRYHFYGDRPTNRLDKPEYFLCNMLDILNSHSDIINNSIQPVLMDYFGHSKLAFEPVYIDATSAFITALLPMVRSKVFAIIGQVTTKPQLLSHLVHELMSFDATLRDEWAYVPDPPTIWKGLTSQLLTQQDYFSRWLQVEKEFALTRYQSIIDAPDSGTLDFDSVDASVTKATRAAIRIHDLLDTVTASYRPLQSFTQKLSFLIDIQIALFDRFHARLHSSLEAYLTMTSSLGRAVQGISAQEYASLQGIPGLDRLCRVYGSADHLERAMRDWSDDVFFLELWQELQARARGNDKRNVAGSLSAVGVARRTSTSLGADSDGDDTSGGLFDETAAAYGRLRTRSGEVIVETLVRSAVEALRFYRRSNAWAALAPSSADGKQTSVSPDLAPVLEVLETSLTFLGRALAKLPLRRIVKQMAAQVDQWICDHLVLVRTFSSVGAEQLMVDVQALVGVVDRCAGGRCGERGFRRLMESARLLGLPAKAVDDGKEGERSGIGDMEVVEAWDVEGGQVLQNGVDADHDEKQLVLEEVGRRLFASNDSARDVLEELGIEVLTESDARRVLQRRVELGS